jgi:CBS domain-containing protein
MLIEKLLPEARRHLVTLPDDAFLIEAARLLRTGIDLVVVCNTSGVLSGVITRDDVVRQISHCHGASCMAPASAAMTRDVVSCRPSNWLTEAWTAMKQGQIKNLPIVDRDSKPLGVLTAQEVFQQLLSEVENEEALLRDYVMSVGYW